MPSTSKKQVKLIPAANQNLPRSGPKKSLEPTQLVIGSGTEA